MEKKKRRYLIALVGCIAAMFLWIFVAVFLTGGRDFGEFLPRDRTVFIGLAVVEGITTFFAFFFAVKLGKMNQYQRPAEPISLTKAERVRARRGGLMAAASLVISLALYILGIFLWKENPGLPFGGAKAALGALFTLGALLIVFSLLGVWRMKKRYNSMSVAQMQDFLLSHREQAEQTAARKLKGLQTRRRLANGYAVFLGLLGAALALFSGWVYQSDDFAVPREFFCAFLILAAFDQLQFPIPKAVVEELENVLPEDEYPNLYRIAREAARKNGCTGEIRVVAVPENTVGIGCIRNTYLVRMGVLTMSMLTEEELYAVLLHEFFHVSSASGSANREADYASFLNEGRNLHVVSNLTNLYYGLLDLSYAMEYELYRYAASVGNEYRADGLMSSCAGAAASSLLKIKYYDLFVWESEAMDRPCLWEPETPCTTVLRDEMARFRACVDSRRADWNDLTKREIQARSSSHPTIWARIQNLGFQELPELCWDETSEGQKALAFMDGRIVRNVEKQYSQAREEHYLTPLERVASWEAAGSSLVAEECPDVLQDLRSLGRETEAMRLCDRTIAELTPIAASSARFIRGAHRLHCYDVGGLEDLYAAIRENSNYIDEGLELIGTFCCLTGMQEELDVYREKAVQISQRQKDEFSQLETLRKKDNLSEEHLPEGMLEDILAYIGTVSQDSIEKIYLVRKTISANFFTSAFVIRFLPDTEESTREEVLHRIFRYLDTSTDWQFSLFSYEEVPRGTVERVPNSCVFQK